MEKIFMLMEKLFVLLSVFLCLVLIVAPFNCKIEYPPLDELDPKAQSVIIGDDAGNHIKIQKAQIKTIHAEGSYIYIHYGNRDKGGLIYSNPARSREMLQRILIWLKADQEKE